MKRSTLITWLSATACLAAIPAVNAQEITCENANFSEAVLESFGSVRYSCREIVERDGRPHALLRAKVVRANPPNLTVRFHRTEDGRLTNPYTFNPEDNYIFTMDGEKKLSLRELSAGNELRVYVPVTGPAS